MGSFVYIFDKVSFRDLLHNYFFFYIMDKLKRALSGNDDDEEDQSIMTQLSDASTLSYATRIKGFVACFIIGIVFSLLGSFFLFSRGLTLFAVFYTLGNIVALLSTCFLMGPVKQIKKMFAKTRVVATIVYLGCLITSVTLALLHVAAIIVLIFVVLQMLAMTWYSLSYIPYARDAVKKCCESCLV